MPDFKPLLCIVSHTEPDNPLESLGLSLLYEMREGIWGFL